MNPWRELWVSFRAQKVDSSKKQNVQRNRVLHQPMQPWTLALRQGCVGSSFFPPTQPNTVFAAQFLATGKSQNHLPRRAHSSEHGLGGWGLAKLRGCTDQITPHNFRAVCATKRGSRQACHEYHTMATDGRSRPFNGIPNPSPPSHPAHRSPSAYTDSSLP